MVLAYLALVCALTVAAPAQDSSAKRKVLSLNQLLGATPSSPQVLQLLRSRQQAVEQLMRESPAAVRSTMLGRDQTLQLLSTVPEAASMVEREGQWSGPLELLAEDDFDHNRSITHWRVRTSKGPVELYFANAAPPVNATCSPRITVAGIGTSSKVAVDSVVALSSTAPACSTKGVQRIAVILLTMPSARSFPAGFDGGYFQQLFFGTSGYTLNNFWEESSYGQTSATGQVFGPFALTQDFNCTDNDNLAAAAIQAASSVDFTEFDRVALIFPVLSCSYGGLGTIGCWETVVPNQNISIAWLPIFPYQDPANYVGAVSHETGHNLGLNHSNTIDYGSFPVGAFDDTGSDTEYGDPFSVMGQVWTVDGSQKILGQYNAEHKSLDLNWLDSSNGDYQEVVANGSFTLLPFESPSGLRALRVLRDPALGGWMWLEYRQPQGLIDSTFSFLTGINEPSTIFDGALVHVEYPSLDPLHTYLADFNAVQLPNDFYNSALQAGQTWSDPYSPLTLSINAADSNGLSASIAYDSPCASLHLTGSPLPASGGTGSITVTADRSCSWRASSHTNWITLNGTISGQGNGNVSFNVAPATGGITQRNGYITIQRQSIQVIQAGTGTVILGASPALGSGQSGRITLSFSDPRGFADINSASINISNQANSSLHACSMFFNRASGTLSLLNDAGTSYLNPLNLLGGGTVSNSQCAISSAGSGIAGSANALQIALQLTFDPSFVGAHSVVATVADSQGTSNSQQVATWLVPLSNGGSPSVFLDPGSVDFGNRAVGSQSLPVPVRLSNNGPGALHISGITVSGGDAGDFSQTNNCGSTLAASASCTLQISFNPAGMGARSSAILVTDNATGSPHSVPLSGSGGNIPVASVNPSSLIFGGQEVGTKSPASVVTIANQGSDALAISNITIAGNNSGDFSQTNNCGSSLAGAATCTISVVFSPSAGGSRLASISIADSASDSPQTVALSGTATDFVVASPDGGISATVSAGQTATYHLQVSPENGFAGTISIACSDQIPWSTCSPSQSSQVSLNGTPVFFTVQVSTAGPAKVAGGTINWSLPSHGPTILLLGFALTLLAAFKKRLRPVVSFAPLLLCVCFSSCGGGGSSTNSAPQVTPAGSYQVTISTSSGGVTHPITLTLKVQ